jgi:hypothetical protein
VAWGGFVKKLWAAGRAGNTPIGSADLNRIEQGIADAHAIARGSVVVTITDTVAGWSASIPHGLGSTPSQVLANCRVPADARSDFLVSHSKDATNVAFAVRGAAAEQYPLPNGYQVTVDWLAFK